MKVFTFRRAILLVLVIIVASAAFYSLYLFDNKYTRSEAQAADGLLVLSTEELKKEPLRFLTRGWAFYPSVLLSPNDFAEQSPRDYMVYTMIGEQARFDFDEKVPYGSATYALELELPEETRTYALELPEIFSAYQLYINDRPLHSMGDPDPARYTALTKSSVLTFDASGRTRLILAVSNFDHFYSGLNYPPAFGTPEAVFSARDARLGVCFVVVTVVLGVGLLALYVGLKRKHGNALLFAVLCLFTCGFIAYSILHAFFELPVFPWYALEVFCGYAAVALVVVLHNRFCNPGKAARCISNITVWTFSLMMLACGLFSNLLSITLMEAMGNAVFVFKIGVAVYLLAISVLALKNSARETMPLFYAAVFYAAAFIWDRLLPLYEPIVGGWFMEIAVFVFVFAIGSLLWRDIVRGYSLSFTLKEEHRQIARQLDMQMEASRQIASRAEETRRLSHDFRQHLRTIGGMAKKDGQGDILAYIRDAGENMAQPDATPKFCENPALDALLRYYFGSARQEGIDMQIRLALPAKLPLSDVELCTVAGNLLENAVEACKRQTGESKSILLTGKTDGDSLYLLFENSFSGPVKRKGERLLSSKEQTDRRGIGIESVRKIVRSHGGTVDILPRERLFSVGISLPLE